MAAAREETFDQFWRQYLRHHAQSGTRMLHMLGTGLAALELVVALITIDPLIALAGTALGYLLAWTGHFLIERNRPAMVSHPAWAFQCDIRMFRLWITGQLKPELKKAGIS
ncbi:MAG TPA: DUF962 domain-containing protein [Methyloceanibacter sp.]|nr:DUF962 domain-containing protein [Methyloceanibacter sp.]